MFYLLDRLYSEHWIHIKDIEYTMQIYPFFHLEKKLLDFLYLKTKNKSKYGTIDSEFDKIFRIT